MQWENAGRLIAAADGTCECGLRRSGHDACADMRDRLFARDFEEPSRYWPYHRLAVDAYCLQHSAYIASATSFAAHIGGLCIAVEFDDSEQRHRAFLQWLNAAGRTLVKPP